MDWFATAVRRIKNYLGWDLWIKQRGILHVYIELSVIVSFHYLKNEVARLLEYAVKS